MTLQTQLISIPLGRDAHRLARQFAAEQATLSKGKRVYLNTLAVYAVHSYLKWLQVDTELEQGNCWHPGLRAISTIADLVIPGLGQLECCPILPGESEYLLPPEAMSDRIGYVAVQFAEQLDEVQLLGFAPALSAHAFEARGGVIQLADFQPIEALVSRLPILTPVSNSTQAVSTHLSQWLENVFETGWQAVHEVLSPSQTTFAFRSAVTESVRRAKRIHLSNELAVVLVVEIHPIAEEIDVLVEVHPVEEQSCLPSGLQLMPLDDAGEVLRQEDGQLYILESRLNDTLLQLPLQGFPGDYFNVKINIGDLSHTERFMI